MSRPHLWSLPFPALRAAMPEDLRWAMIWRSNSGDGPKDGKKQLASDGPEVNAFLQCSLSERCRGQLT